MMVRKRFSILWAMMITILLLGSATAAPGQDGRELFDEANRFFRQAVESPDASRARALYQKALVRYQSLVERGVVNGRLYYNIGNTWFRLGDLGRALVNYRRAERFMPDDENLRQNINYLLSRQQDNITPKADEQIVKTLFFWHYDFSSAVRRGILLAANALFWGLLLVRLRRPGAMTGLLITLLAVMALAAGSLAVEAFSGGRQHGVIISPEVVARKGDGASYAPSFHGPLHAGLDFTLVEERGGWLRIELADGSRCWIPATAAEMVDGGQQGKKMETVLKKEKFDE